MIHTLVWQIKQHSWAKYPDGKSRFYPKHLRWIETVIPPQLHMLQMRFGKDMRIVGVRKGRYGDSIYLAGPEIPGDVRIAPDYGFRDEIRSLITGKPPGC